MGQCAYNKQEKLRQNAKLGKTYDNIYEASIYFYRERKIVDIAVPMTSLKIDIRI